jgi:hypothetical protein
VDNRLTLLYLDLQLAGVFTAPLVWINSKWRDAASQVCFLKLDPSPASAFHSIKNAMRALLSANVHSAFIGVSVESGWTVTVNMGVVVAGWGGKGGGKGDACCIVWLNSSLFIVEFIVESSIRVIQALTTTASHHHSDPTIFG